MNRIGRMCALGMLSGLTIGAVMAIAPPPAQTQPSSRPAKAPAPSTLPTAPSAPAHSAITPIPRRDGWWNDRHKSLNRRAQNADIDLLFLGDSITQGWERDGKAVWLKYYQNRRAANFGIGGDRTQHLLWRLHNGNLEGLDKHSPKLVVLLIGANNSNADENTAEEIAEGITAIVKTLRTRLPQTKVLLLGIFPRGPGPSRQREKNKKASELAAKIDDGKMVHYLDVGHRFLATDGTLSKEVMPDYLHLSPKGYEIWAEAMDAKVKELMQER